MVEIKRKDKFGNWTVVDGYIYGKRNSRRLKVKCICGTVKYRLLSELRYGNSKSCGCSIIKHGESNKKITKEYKTWIRIRRRCDSNYSINFNEYGKRGIKYCKRWNKYKNFLKDIGRAPSNEHSIERIDNDKGYFKENCKWATPIEQANNRRSNKFIRAFGEEKTMAQWARDLGINYSTLKDRIYRKWPVEKALTI